MESGGKSKLYFTGLLGGQNVFIRIKHLEQFLAYTKCYVYVNY